MSRPGGGASRRGSARRSPCGEGCWIDLYKGCFHPTSRECTGDLPPEPYSPSAAAAPRPQAVAAQSPPRPPEGAATTMAETLVPVWLTVGDLPRDLRPPPPGVRSTVLDYATRAMERHVTGSTTELLRVVGGGCRGRESFLLGVTMDFPRDRVFLVPGYVLWVLRDGLEDLREGLARCGGPLADAELRAEAFDPNDDVEASGCDDDDDDDWAIDRDPAGRTTSRIQASLVVEFRDVSAEVPADDAGFRGRLCGALEDHAGDAVRRAAAYELEGVRCRDVRFDPYRRRRLGGGGARRPGRGTARAELKVAALCSSSTEEEDDRCQEGLADLVEDSINRDNGSELKRNLEDRGESALSESTVFAYETSAPISSPLPDGFSDDQTPRAEPETLILSSPDSERAVLGPALIAVFSLVALLVAGILFRKGINGRDRADDATYPSKPIAEGGPGEAAGGGEGGRASLALATPERWNDSFSSASSGGGRRITAGAADAFVERARRKRDDDREGRRRGTRPSNEGGGVPVGRVPSQSDTNPDDRRENNRRSPPGPGETRDAQISPTALGANALRTFEERMSKKIRSMGLKRVGVNGEQDSPLKGGHRSRPMVSSTKKRGPLEDKKGPKRKSKIFGQKIFFKGRQVALDDDGRRRKTGRGGLGVSAPPSLSFEDCIKLKVMQGAKTKASGKAMALKEKSTQRKPASKLKYGRGGQGTSTPPSLSFEDRLKLKAMQGAKTQASGKTMTFNEKSTQRKTESRLNDHRERQWASTPHPLSFEDRIKLKAMPGAKTQKRGKTIAFNEKSMQRKTKSRLNDNQERQWLSDPHSLLFEDRLKLKAMQGAKTQASGKSMAFNDSKQRKTESRLNDNQESLWASDPHPLSFEDRLKLKAMQGAKTQASGKSKAFNKNSSQRKIESRLKDNRESLWASAPHPLLFEDRLKLKAMQGAKKQASGKAKAFNEDSTPRKPTSKLKYGQGGSRGIRASVTLI